MENAREGTRLRHDLDYPMMLMTTGNEIVE